MKTFSLFYIVVFLFVAGICQAQENKNKDGVYFVVDEMPEYPGGENSLRQDLVSLIQYPEEAQKGGIQGKVYVTFVVDEHGKVCRCKNCQGSGTDARQRGITGSWGTENLETGETQR